MLHSVAVRLAVSACVVATALALAAAPAQAASCGNFAPVGNVTLEVNQLGSYNFTAGQAKFTATMEWGDGSASTVFLSPASPRATVTHRYAAPGSYSVALTVRGELEDGTSCSNRVAIASVTVPTPTTPTLSPEGLPQGPLPAKPPFIGPTQQPCPPACGPKMPIGGYNPKAATPATPVEPFTTTTWSDDFKKLKAKQRKTLSRVDKAGTALGSLCTVVGIPAALGSGPEPTTKLALVGCGALVAAMKGGAALGDLWFDYVDPPDPNFGTVAEPDLSPGPQVSSPPLSARRASALNALTDNFVHSREVQLALLTAVNRAQGAGDAGATAARAAQLQAVARFANQLAALVDERPGLRRDVAKSLKGIKPLRPARVRKAGRTVQRKGLPEDLAGSFDSFGVPEEWVTGKFEDAVEDIRGRIDAAALLRTPAFDELDRALADSFRSLAQNLQ